MILISGIEPAAAGEPVTASGQAVAVPDVDRPHPAPAPAQKPGPTVLSRPSSPGCTAVVTARYSCVQISAPDKSAAERLKAARGPQTQAAPPVLPTPQYCTSTTITGLRTEECVSWVITYTTYLITNGVSEVSGVLQLDAYSFIYSAVDLPNFNHQIQLVPFAGWGDALRASLNGAGRASGACTLTLTSFPLQPASPFGVFRSGTASFNTTATAVGAIGYCTTTWDVNFITPGYTDGHITQSLYDMRCDNALGANLQRPRRVGCVIAWYASTAWYDKVRYPSLASHVQRAQASGLPGGVSNSAVPLTKTSNTAIVNTNRNRACGDAPSIAGKSCDEYPLATTLQGLSAGGVRRTFSGCNINAPTNLTAPHGRTARGLTLAGQRKERMSEYHALVPVSDHTFGLFDDYQIPIDTADWSNGLIVTMEIGASIYTGGATTPPHHPSHRPLRLRPAPEQPDHTRQGPPPAATRPPRPTSPQRRAQGSLAGEPSRPITDRAWRQTSRAAARPDPATGRAPPRPLPWPVLHRRRLALPDQPPESVQVHRHRIDGEQVAPGLPDDPHLRRVGQQPAQPGQITEQRLPGAAEPGPPTPGR